MKRVFSAFLMVMLGAVLPAVAQQYTTETWSFGWDKGRNDGGEGFYHFSNGSGEAESYTETLNGVVWSASSSQVLYCSYTANMGQAFGKPAKLVDDVTLASDGFEGEITEVKVSVRKSAQATGGVLKVSVADNDYLNDGNAEVALPDEYTEYTFKPAGDAPKEGKIKIVLTQSGDTKGVLYVRSLGVTYRTEQSDVAAPVASPAAGTYDEAQSITLSAAAGATIYYTTDGSNPKLSETRTAYTAPISISATTTLKFIAEQDGKYSAVAEAKYVIRQDPELSFEVPSVTVEYPHDVYGPWLNNPHNVEPIYYYAEDNSVAEIDNYGDIWTKAAGTTTVYAVFAGNDAYYPATASYVLTVTEPEPLQSPTISPAGGTFTGPVDVTLTAGSDWGDRALALWYSTTAADFDELTDDPIIWYPESDNLYATVKSTTIRITESCRLLLVSVGYGVYSPLVEATFTINEEPTGISNIEAERTADATYYNLAGQRVASPKKGIYVGGGKKRVVK